jgi:hypothetical protein
MRKIILSVISTLVVIVLLFGGLTLVRARNRIQRARATYRMQKMMAHNARKIATPAEAKTST